MNWALYHNKRGDNELINEVELQNICSKYNIKYRIFHQTNIITLYTGLDDWMIKYNPGKSKPYCLMHKNKIRNRSKFHVQRHLRTLYQSLDCIASHKNILKTIYGSHNSYSQTPNRNIC